MSLVRLVAEVGPLIPGLDPVAGSYLAAGVIVAVVLVASRTLSRRTGLPTPVFLVVAGAAVSFVPHMGTVELSPRVVFLGFLPPLVYHAGLVTSPRELRAHALPIGLGALGLVLATTFAVAGIAWAVAPSLGWVGAFVLGSVVSPTDPVAATSVLSRLGAARSITTILEGESLVNDGVALALFTLGIAAVATPTGFGGGLVATVKVAGGGTAFGLVAGWLVGHIRRPLSDPASQIVVSLVVPFATYLPADALGLSGVLATLATGLVLGQQPMSGLGPSGRIRVAEFWQVLVFLLESVLFVLVGLQLRRLFDAISNRSAGEVALLAGMSVAGVVVVRVAWWLAVPSLRWRPRNHLVDTGGVPWQERLALGWCGLRGAISLAAALSIPAAVSGHVFPGRDLIVFTTFCVLAATLVGEGTTLAWLLGRLGLAESSTDLHQRALAERQCAEGALRLLDRLAAEGEVSDDVAERLRGRYERRLEQVRATVEAESSDRPQGARSPRAVERRLLLAQHGILQELHRTGEISFTVMRDVRRDLDLEHIRYER